MKPIAVSDRKDAFRSRRIKYEVQRFRRSNLFGFEMLEDRRMMAVLELFDSVTAPALPAGWTQSTTGANPWTTVATQSDSAPNHAFVANLPVVSDSILTSPSFVLSPTTPRLSFRNAYNTEADWDGGVLEIAINGGAFSDILAAGGSFVSGGYVGVLSVSSNPLSERAAWQGDSGGYVSTVVDLPTSAFNQNVVLRWRMGSDASVNVVGWQIDTVTLDSVPTQDFGDAPASYPVTLIEDGARHTVGSLILGTQADLDSDGFHSSDALGDGADEDGVVFQGSFTRGVSKPIQVTASQAGGLLNAWVDWNADGDWADSGEQVFTDQALVAGVNSLALNVPATASAANTFARFRVSTTSGLSFTGAAADGEVEDHRLTVIAAGVWGPLGPFGATNGQVEGIVNRPVVGAVHTVLAHPTNPDILYIGSVNGGVWKTTNATAASPNWTPLTDSIASQSIGALTFDLADPSFNTIYAGIGHYSSFNRIGNGRTGLIRSTDGGQTWQVVNGAGLLTGKNISGVYANGNTVVVSVNVANNFTFSNIGIFRSTNGGATFTQISTGNGSATGLPGGVSYDLVVDPITPTTLYTSTIFSDSVGGVNGVYKSINSGATWTKVSTPAMETFITSSTSNLELAVGRSNEVYAGIINAGAFAGLFRSPDGGGTWVQMDSPKTNENGTDVGLNPSGGKGPTSGAPEAIAGGQGSIHFSIVADPNNANLVYVGGDRQPRTNGDTGSFPNSIGANDFSGRLFRGDASQPAGSQFVHLTHRNNLGAIGGGTASNSSPHADSREMTFDANGNLLEVDDGGVYRRTSPQTNAGDWFSVIGNLQVTEAHDVVWDSLSNVAITGNQDTGSTYQPSENATQWISVSTADGGDVAVDNIQLAGSNQSVRYTSFQNLGGLRRTVWNASGGLVSTTFPSLTPNAGSTAITGAFRTPLETNSVAGGRLLIQGSNGLYESLDAGATVTSIGVSSGANSSSSNAIWYGGMQNNVANPDLVWAASNSDVFVRTAGNGNVVATAADPTSLEIRDLAVNTKDWANAFVIGSNKVFQTTNVGASWSDITGNLMSFVSDLRSIAFIAGAVTSSIVVGTNFGIYASSTTALGTWLPIGSGLPNVISYDLDYDATDDILVVGTLGRGAWRLPNVSSVLGDTNAPSTTSFTRSNPSAALTSADTLVYLVTFSEPVTGVDAADFVVSGTTGTISVSQLTTSTYSVTISGGDLATLNGSVGLNFSASPSITDLSLNVLPNTEPPTDELFVVDNASPTVTSIIASSSTWLPGFIDGVDGGGANAGNGLGIVVTPNSIVPNLGINRIYIQFSEPVVGFSTSQVALLGVVIADYASIASVSYDSINNRGLIQLSSPLTRDKLRIGVSTFVTDAVLNGIDGDSNGSAGGVFDFQFNVLVGDANGSGSVNGGDLTVFRNAFNTSANGPNYNGLADWNSNGSVNGGDLPTFSANFNTSLPAGNPAALNFNPPPPRAIALRRIDAFFSQLDFENDQMRLRPNRFIARTRR